MTEVIVRETTVDDVAAIQRVARAGWHASYDDIIGPERVDDTVDSWYDPDRLVADDVSDPERPFFVAEQRGNAGDGEGREKGEETMQEGEETKREGQGDASGDDSSGDDASGEGDASDGVVVGFAEAAAARDEPGIWQLYRIYVHPDAWGEGVGTLLLEEIEAAVRERGVEKLRVSVHAENDVGVAFYEARGFDRVATEPAEQLGGRRHEYAKRLCIGSDWQ